MGQICAKCKGSEEPDEEEVLQGEGSFSDGPLLDTEIPPAAETPVKESPQAEPPAEESPKATPTVIKSPEATSPSLVSLEPKFPVPQSSEPESPLLESSEAKSPLLEFHEAKLPLPESSEAKSPLPESSEAKSPLLETPKSKSPVVEYSATKPSVPLDAPTPVSQHQDDRGGSHKSPLLVSDTPDAALVITPPAGKFLNFPILQDMKTIRYIQKSKVLVILKGLPGSGKSYLANTLKQIYKDAVVCSADYYFMKDGRYQFKGEELNLAHESCQESAKQAAISGASLIIIDNTNVRAWAYKYYLSLSKEYHYTPLIMEPQSPWAKNTKELEQRNSHSVKKDALDKMLKKFETALPLYYWWFLNEADSAEIIFVAQDWLKKALQVQNFFQDFSKFSKLSSVEEMLSYYKKNEDHTDYKVLHATACVARRGKAKNAKGYIAKKVVKDSSGKCFPLQLIGFVITPRTFGVRLRLGEDSLELWGMDDHEIEAEDTASGQTSKAGQQSAKENKRVSLANTSVRRDSCQTTLRKEQSQVHDDRFFPTSGRGSRAHLTLGCAPGVHAKTTGFDLVKVISQEQEMMKTETHHQLSEKIQTFSVPEGELRTYGDSIWVIYPEKEIHVDSLYSGFY